MILFNFKKLETISYSINPYWPHIWFKKISALAVFILLFTSCGNTKYHYYFEKGSIVDFTKGEWILNKAYTNYNEERINKIASREFGKILDDSLFPIESLRKDKLVPAQLSFNPSQENLYDLKTATGKDYLINVQSNMIKNEMGSFAHAPAMGSTVKTNEAGIIIKIYDLNSQTLLSEGMVTGIAKVTKSADGKNWDYVNNAQTLSMQGLIKLIKRYKKNGRTY
ncbi:MAG: hypothetical protein ABJ092_13130 [Gillisia sp.]